MKVLGEGPRDASIFACGEAPGYTEAETGRVFAGKAGRELTRYIEKSARLDRRDWYITNLCKFRPETKRVTGNNPPTAADIKRDEPELAQELVTIAPQWIVAIGRYSLQWLLGRKATVTDCRGFAFPLPDATLEKIARLTSQPVDDVRELLGSTLVISVTLPAAGLHDTDTQSDIHFDFKRLGQMVRGEIDTQPPIDQFPNPDYRDVEILPSLTPRMLALDTEGLKGRIWGASVAWQPGSARVVRTASPRAIRSLRRLALDEGHTLVMHNAPHDIPIVCEMFGIDVYEFSRHVKFEDTMQMAFIQRLVPKGLKQLGRRFEGIKDVRKYMEVVGDADRRLAEQYLTSVVGCEHACAACDGSGQWLNATRTHKKTGKPLEPRLEKCPTCEGDGTSWEPPQERLVWDAGKGQMRLSRGWRMGRRVRSMLNKLAEQQATVDDRDDDGGDDEDRDQLVDDFAEAALTDSAGDERAVAGLRRKWLNIDYEFRTQVEDTIGQMPEATLDDIDRDEAVVYSARDADMTIRVLPKLQEMLAADDLLPVYESDRDVIPMITQMMEVGWKIDVPYLNELSDWLQTEMDGRLYKLERLVGHYVNPNSMKQVGDLLFGEMGLQPIKLTSTGAESTDNKVLKDLQIQMAAVMDRDKQAKRAFDGLTYILDYRERSKMRSTYTVALPRKVDENDRLHTEFKNASVASRRLASANPNLMNIPSRTELGKRIKYAFTCDDDHVLVDNDYNQLEFRILAYAARERQLIKAIRDGLDPHALTTSKIFKIPIEQVHKGMWQRTAAKTCSFAILYGASAPTIKAQLKLLANIDVPEDECQRWIDDYTRINFPAIGEYIDDCIAHARRYGYSVDMWGHRRYLPGVHSAIPSIAAEAERVAVNHTIQSAASGVVKKAMKATWEDLLPKFRRRAYVEPLLQLHDALTHEVNRKLAKEFAQALVRTMGSVVDWSVPITADCKITMRWGAEESLEVAA
jgi:uracil-DNA glycosylase family 4